jgi:diguanylate cyclase (GGDEF)-like protein
MAPASPGSDLASLIERMDYLHALRASFACVVLGASVFMTRTEGGTVGITALVTAAYLVAAIVSEWVRRSMGVRALWAIGGMLLVDGVYLAWATYATTGPESPLRFLIYLHIVAGTLLASYRTSLKLALWHTLLFFVVVYAQAGGLLGVGGGDLASLPGGRRFGSLASFNIMALWGMALGTAAFSSLVERELRRQKVELQALASMAGELDRKMKPTETGEILLERLSRSFGFARGVVLASPEGGDLALVAQSGARAPSEDHRGVDPVVERAWATREVVLAKRLDPSIDPRLATMLPDARNLLIVPLFAEGNPIGVVALERGGGARHIRRWAVSMVHQFASHGALALHNGWLLEEVRRMAETDPLTELANRRVFHRSLERELARAARSGQQVSLLILDADHFKDYNDRFGHRAGDELLQSLARALAEHSRAFDTVARYGGEEFAVILPECSVEEALSVAERLRLVASGLEGRAPVTLSGGVATYPVHGRDSAALIEAADAALYESKRTGRDRLSLARDGRGTGRDLVTPTPA